MRYRFSAWMRIDSISGNMPFFKLAMYTDGQWFENSMTPPYDSTNIGRWQNIIFDFIAPSDRKTEINFAVEKRPFKDSVYVDMNIDDISLEIID
jgi:hypothetical protein